MTPTKIAIEGGIVLDMVSGAAPMVANVLIEGDRIVSVGAGIPSATAPHEVIDARGCWVMPGLINAHTHTPLTMMRSTSDDCGPPTQERISTMPAGQDWRGRLTADEMAWATRLAIAEMIHSGTTTFVDTSHAMEGVAQAVVDTGIRAALGSEIMTFRNHPKEWLPYHEATARRTFEAAGRFAADWNGKGRGRVMALIAPHETATCHEPWLTRSARLADELGLAMTIHVAENEWELQFCQEQYQRTPVQVLEAAGVLQRRVLGAHCLFVTDADIELLARAPFSAVACLGSYLKLATPATPVPRLMEKKVNVALGTDSAGTNNNLNLWDEIHLNATLHGFLARNASLVPGDTALRMATTGGAAALGLTHQLGTLEPGKKADLIVLDARRAHLIPQEGALIGNLVYSANGSEVRDVVVDGRILMQGGRITSFDEAEVLRQVEAIVRRRRAEVGLPPRFERP
jgi:5-methylthioadenosine/S-adenosylhomocysteine deaminase